MFTMKTFFLINSNYLVYTKCFHFVILHLFFGTYHFFSEGGTLPSTNTISKPINELEKMLETNKDTTGKLPSTFLDNLSQNLRHGRFSSDLLVKQLALVRSDQFQIIACLAFLALPGNSSSSL